MFMGHAIDIQQDKSDQLVNASEEEGGKGKWAMKKIKKRPFYEEINTSEMVYHWRSGT